jgi:hypothetical protein
MEAVCSSETLVTTHQTAWYNNPQGHNVCLQILIRAMVLLVFNTNHARGHTEYGHNFTFKWYMKECSHITGILVLHNSFGKYYSILHIVVQFLICNTNKAFGTPCIYTAVQSWTGSIYD